jgi:hypothetical protein
LPCFSSYRNDDASEDESEENDGTSSRSDSDDESDSGESDDESPVDDEENNSDGDNDEPSIASEDKERMKQMMEQWDDGNGHEENDDVGEAESD